MRVTVINHNNEKIEVSVVRYFKIQTGSYFMYSLDEVDENGYVKLYATKVTIVNGLMVGNNIVDDNEWNEVKSLIKVIIRENQSGNVTSVETLPALNLTNLKIEDARAFKLAGNLVSLLTASDDEGVQLGQVPSPTVAEPVMNPEPSVAPIPDPTAPVMPQYTVQQPATPQVDTNTVDYQAKCQELESENANLRASVEQMKNQIQQIKAILG